MLLINFNFWQNIHIRCLKLLRVGFVTSVCLLSLPVSSGHAFSWQKEETGNQTTLNFKLDNPYQIEQIRRPRSTEIYIPLKTPCGNLEHIWVAKDEAAILKAVLLEYDGITIKHARFVDLKVTRPKSQELSIRLTKKKQVLKEESKDVLNRTTSRLQMAADSGKVGIHTTKALLLPEKSNFVAASEVELKKEDDLKDPFLAELELELAAIDTLGPVEDPLYDLEVDTEALLLANDLRRSLHGLRRLPYSAMQEQMAKSLAAREKSRAEDDTHNLAKPLTTINSSYAAPLSDLSVSSLSRNCAEVSVLDGSETESDLSSVNLAQASNDHIISSDHKSMRATINLAGPDDWDGRQSVSKNRAQGEPQPYSQSGVQGGSGPKPWSSVGDNNGSSPNGRSSQVRGEVENTINAGRQPGNGNITSSSWRSSMEQSDQARSPKYGPDFDDQGISHGHVIPGEIDSGIAHGHTVPGVTDNADTRPAPRREPAQVAPSSGSIGGDIPHKPSEPARIFEHRQPISTEVRTAPSTNKPLDEESLKSGINQEAPIESKAEPKAVHRPANNEVRTNQPSNRPYVEPKPEVQPKPAQNGQAKAAPKAPTSQPRGKSQGKEVHGQADLTPEGLRNEKQEEVEEEKPAEPPTIYVDEKGNPVEKPLDIPGMLKEVERLLELKEHDDALVILNRLRESPDIDNESLEKVLYYVSDANWSRYEKDLLAGYDDIVAATNEAMNFNTRSPRLPDALLRLALINCVVGNVAEAKAYVGVLLRHYPNFPANSVALTALGQEELKKNLYADAEKSFTTVLDKYPESGKLKEASVGLITACTRLKKYDRAKLILDFANKRWSRHYVDDPDFLLVQDDIERHYGMVDARLQTIWQLINLVPNHPKAPGLFLEMGDMYMKAKNPNAADFLYNQILQIAPESQEAITAKLRLAEKGIFETPLDPEKLYLIFGRGSTPPFRELYTETAETSNTYPDAVLARLKLAFWYLWDRQYIEAMAKAVDFIDSYPDHKDKHLAEDIIWDSFKAELKTSLSEQNYGRILVLWNGFPLVRKRYGEPDPKLRYALAQGERERGNEEAALQMLRHFLKSPMDPEYGEIAFLDFFNKYLSEGNWNGLLDLGKTVASWDLKPQLRDDLDYAMALAAQNLSLNSAALDLWNKIAAKENCPLYQKAWAMVFLAKNAERKKDIRLAYDYNKKVVDLFSTLQEERSDKADPERIKMP